jgi:hypothetical protein
VEVDGALGGLGGEVGGVCVDGESHGQAAFPASVASGISMSFPVRTS